MPFRVQVQAQNADFVDTNDTNYDGIKSRKKISRKILSWLAGVVVVVALGMWAASTFLRHG